MLLGRNFEQKGQLGCLDLETCSLVLSCGLDSPAPKRHPNEDAIGAARSYSGCTVGVVADAHFGRESAELVVGAVLSQVFRSEGPASAHSFAERVGTSLSMVAHQLKQQRTDSACALVVARRYEEELIWASVGDCRLYQVEADGRAKELSPVEQAWFGAHFRPRDLNWGRCGVNSSQRLLLATDGLPECQYGIPTLGVGDLGPIAARGGLSVAAKELAQAALDGGGEDNIGILLMGDSRGENDHALG
jgi:serine/threonine protein phosphatase PrpC